MDRLYSFVSVLALCQNPASEKSSILSKKEIAIKAAKIAGYATELTLSSIARFIVPLPGCFDLFKGLIGLKTSVMKNRQDKMNDFLFALSVQVPFIGSIGHSLYGLGTELKPIVQTGIQKMKQRYSHGRKIVDEIPIYIVFLLLTGTVPLYPQEETTTLTKKEYSFLKAAKVAWA